MTRPLSDATDRDPHENRRKHPRVEAQLPVEAVHDGSIVQIEASNICEGGAYCRSDAPLAVMTRMEVSIDLPACGQPGAPAPVHVGAIVVRCEPHPIEVGVYNLALLFSSLDEPARARIAAFVAIRREAEQRIVGARRGADG